METNLFSMTGEYKFVERFPMIYHCDYCGKQEELNSLKEKEEKGWCLMEIVFNNVPQSKLIGLLYTCSKKCSEKILEKLLDMSAKLEFRS